MAQSETGHNLKMTEQVNTSKEARNPEGLWTTASIRLKEFEEKSNLSGHQTAGAARNQILSSYPCDRAFFGSRLAPFLRTQWLPFVFAKVPH